MTLRTSILVAALTVSTLAAAASAEPKTVCNTITDPKGDAEFESTPNNPSLDIVSGDLASNATTLTGVIRVDKLSVPSVQSPVGQRFLVEFSVKGAPDRLYLRAQLDPSGNHFAFGHTVDEGNGNKTRHNLGAATGAADPVKSEVRISVPIAAFSKHARLAPGTRLGGVTAESAAIAGLLLHTDAAAGKSYVAGTPSCVKVGK